MTGPAVGDPESPQLCRQGSEPRVALRRRKQPVTEDDDDDHRAERTDDAGDHCGGVRFGGEGLGGERPGVPDGGSDLTDR